MNPKGKKFLSLFLVLSLMMISVNLYAKERRGAKLIITKKEGQQVEGELITVKPNSLLLLDAEGKDVSIDIADIKVIRIVKKSKVLLGSGLGLLIGAGPLTLYGYIAYKSGSEFWSSLDALGLVFLTSLTGIIIGGILGAAAGIDEIIQIEGRPSSSIEYILDKLCKKARIRDYK